MVIFDSRKDDLRSVAAHANLYPTRPIFIPQGQSLSHKNWPNGRRPPSCPNKVGAGWHTPIDSYRSEYALQRQDLADTPRDRAFADGGGDSDIDETEAAGRGIGAREIEEFAAEFHAIARVSCHR